MLKRFFGFLADIAWKLGCVNLGAKLMVMSLETQETEQVKVRVKMHTKPIIEGEPIVVFEDKAYMDALSLGPNFQEIARVQSEMDVN